MEDRIPAPQVARLIGIKTPTLAKWRCLGKGPQGWIQVSPTHVTYPRSEVERFLVARAAVTPTRS
jgi:transposase-like protein